MAAAALEDKHVRRKYIRTKPVIKLTLTCPVCGEQFIRYPCQIDRPGRGQFCSRKCKDSNGRVSVKCSWPECQETMMARRFKSQIGLTWKVDLTRRGSYMKWPLCFRHLSMVADHLHAKNRLPNGKLKWFTDPGTDLGTRGVSNRAARLIIWSKTDGKCTDCGSPLEFGGLPKKWNVDHKVPVFKGGRTNYNNLWPLCLQCHGIKSSTEKSEATKTRHREYKSGRWLTHPEKDALISALRAEVTSLRERINRHEIQKAVRRRGKRQEEDPSIQGRFF